MPPPDEPKYKRAARLSQEGASIDRIATEMDVSRVTANGYLVLARNRGILPPLVPQRMRGGTETWSAHQRKGAAPTFGSISQIIAPLTAAEVDLLLSLLTPEDGTLADFLARLLKEHLDAHADTQG